MIRTFSIKTKVVSPLVFFVISWIIVLVTYELHWSSLFPKLNTEVRLFFYGAVLLCAILFLSSKPLEFKFEIDEDRTNSILRTCIYICITCVVIGIYFTGSFPLLSFLLGTYSYHSGDDNALPFVHIIMFTLSHICVCISFLMYKVTKQIAYLKYLFLFFLPSILYISRSNLIFDLMYCIMIGLSLTKLNFKYLFKRVILICISIFAFLFLFGIVGELRSGDSNQSDSWIELLTEPTNEFKETGLSPMFLWGYAYVASPLANFQYAENNKQNTTLDDYDVLYYHFLPNFISKRLFPSYKPKSELIVRYFTVSTVFADPFLHLGWIGVFYSFFGMLCIILLLYIMKKNNLFVYLSFIFFCTIVFFNIFDNMYNYMGAAPQFLTTTLLAFWINKTKKTKLCNARKK